MTSDGVHQVIANGTGVYIVDPHGNTEKLSEAHAAALPLGDGEIMSNGSHTLFCPSPKLNDEEPECHHLEGITEQHATRVNLRQKQDCHSLRWQDNDLDTCAFYSTHWCADGKILDGFHAQVKGHPDNE